MYSLWLFLPSLCAEISLSISINYLAENIRICGIPLFLLGWRNLDKATLLKRLRTPLISISTSNHPRWDLVLWYENVLPINALSVEEESVLRWVASPTHSRVELNVNAIATKGQVVPNRTNLLVQDIKPRSRHADHTVIVRLLISSETFKYWYEDEWNIESFPWLPIETLDQIPLEWPHVCLVEFNHLWRAKAHWRINLHHLPSDLRVVEGECHSVSEEWFILKYPCFMVGAKCLHLSPLRLKFTFHGVWHVLIYAKPKKRERKSNYKSMAIRLWL